MLGVGERSLLDPQARRHVPEGEEPVLGGGALQGGDLLHGQVLVELHAAGAPRDEGAGDPRGVVRPGHGEPVLPPAEIPGDERPGGEQARADEPAGGEPVAGLGERRAVDVAGIADRGHAVGHEEQEEEVDEAEDVVGRDVRVHVHEGRGDEAPAVGVEGVVARVRTAAGGHHVDDAPVGHEDVGLLAPDRRLDDGDLRQHEAPGDRTRAVVPTLDPIAALAGVGGRDRRERRQRAAAATARGRARELADRRGDLVHHAVFLARRDGPLHGGEIEVAGGREHGPGYHVPRGAGSYGPARTQSGASAGRGQPASSSRGPNEAL